MSPTKLSLCENDVIYKLFPPRARESFVCDIPAGNGNIEKIFTVLRAINMWLLNSYVRNRTLVFTHYHWLAGRATETTEAPSWGQLSSVYSIFLAAKREQGTLHDLQEGVTYLMCTNTNGWWTEQGKPPDNKAVASYLVCIQYHWLVNCRAKKNQPIVKPGPAI